MINSVSERKSGRESGIEREESGRTREETGRRRERWSERDWESECGSERRERGCIIQYLHYRR